MKSKPHLITLYVMKQKQSTIYSKCSIKEVSTEVLVSEDMESCLIENASILPALHLVHENSQDHACRIHYCSLAHEARIAGIKHNVAPTTLQRP